MASDLDPDDADEELTLDGAAALIAQLHYDRADVVRISEAAGHAMDVVISIVQQAVKARWNAVTDGKTQD